jgi:putative acetyltransferase
MIEITYRDARDEDTTALITLIAAVFDEYPGCVMDVDGEIPELRKIASHFRALGGRFWVAERQGEVVGCVGFAPLPNGRAQLHKLYVRANCRRIGIGGRLCELVEATARERGITHLELWSDTRFETAHLVYERRGYRRGSQTRELHDKSATVEFFFEKGVAPTATDALARALAETPQYLRALLSGWDETQLRRKPKPDQFSALEHLCHLRDLECEGYGVRIQRLLSEDRPFLANIDGDLWARERRYNSQDGQQALQSFTEARLANLRTLKSARPGELERCGVLETVGPITLKGLFELIRAHDGEHMQSLASLR